MHTQICAQELQSSVVGCGADGGCFKCFSDISSGIISVGDWADDEVASMVAVLVLPT